MPVRSTVNITATSGQNNICRYTTAPYIICNITLTALFLKTMLFLFYSSLTVYWILNFNVIQCLFFHHPRQHQQFKINNQPPIQSEHHYFQIPVPPVYLEVQIHRPDFQDSIFQARTTPLHRIHFHSVNLPNKLRQLQRLQLVDSGLEHSAKREVRHLLIQLLFVVHYKYFFSN